MGLDREDIERRDFPTARRGYDPAAVDAHLRHLANEIERLGRAAETPAPAPGLAASTSEQVRSILEAAEQSAGRLRADAGEEARGHVERVESAAGEMVDRLGVLQGELNRLLEGLRASAGVVTEGLLDLRARVQEMGGEVGVPEDLTEGRPSGVAPADAAPADVASPQPGDPAPEGGPAGAGEAASEAASPGRSAAASEAAPPGRGESTQAAASGAGEPAPEATTSGAGEPAPEAATSGAGEPAPEAATSGAGEPTPEAAPAEAASPPAGDRAAAVPSSGSDAAHLAGPRARSTDVEGARLAALELALAGRPREETARYLALHFDLEDAAALLDDVYARIGR